MKLSKRGEYALRALIDLGVAQELGRPLLSLSELSDKEQGLPAGPDHAREHEPGTSHVAGHARSQARADPAVEGMKGAIAKAEALAKEIPDGWVPQQFIKLRKPSFEAIAVEPKDSPIITQTRNGDPLKPGPHKIQGTGAGFIPGYLHLAIVDDVITVTNDDAIATARRLAKEEGILAGISTGANVFAAIEVAKRPENKGKRIVTIGCSTGERYLSTALAEEARREVSG